MKGLADLSDDAMFVVVMHYLKEHPVAAWGDGPRPEGVGPGPDCTADACPVLPILEAEGGHQRMILMTKKVVAWLLDARDRLRVFTAESPGTVEASLALCRRWLVARVWHDITQPTRVWLSEGNFKTGLAVLNTLLEKEGPHSVVELARHVGRTVPTLFEVVEDWSSHEYRVLHDKTLPFVREWQDGRVVRYRYNPEFEHRHPAVEKVEVRPGLHPQVFLTRNLWVGGTFAPILLGLLPRESVRFLPEWPEEMAALAGSRALLLAYDAYFARKQPWAPEFTKLWLDHRERPAESTVGVIEEFVRGGGRFLGLHDGGMALAARLAGLSPKALLLDWGREVEVRESRGSTLRRLGQARNNYASVVPENATATAEGLGPVEPWFELVATEADRTRLKNGKLLAGFGRRVGQGSVAGWTFLAGGPGNPEDLGNTGDAHLSLRSVLARFAGV